MSTTRSKKHKRKQAHQQKTSPASAASKTTGGGHVKREKLQISPGNWKVKAGIFFLLVIATLFLYSSDLHLGFFSVDDEGYVIKDPWIQKISFENLTHIFTTPYFSNFSPLHLLSYMIDYAIAGPDPYVFHLSSNLWAGIAAGFVYLVAFAFTRRNLVAIAAALLFVAHPAHVEAIAWISSRKDLVATSFTLASLLAYLEYRKGGSAATKWYISSVLLFIFGLLGKVSVATFPAIFLAIDLFVEKRSLKSSIIDKIPYLAFTIIIGLFVYSAQPLSGNRFDPYVFSIALGQSAWLLTGLGDYVIYRQRPDGAGMGFEIAAVLLLILLFIAPLLLRKRKPKTMVLIYWVLLGLIPAQLLSFVHPVTDRYLFFPSVAIAILIAWGVVTLVERLNKKLVLASVVILMAIAFLWTMKTLNYLSEWNDPRSVWFASSKKSNDPDIPYSLGGHYLDMAGRLAPPIRGAVLPTEEATKIAALVWKDNPKLPTLLTELNAGRRGGALEKEFQNDLWSLSWQNFELALQNLGSHVLPHLLYKRGILQLDRGDMQAAKKEFMNALEETSRSSVKDIRDELSVSAYNAIAIIEWKLSNYREALKWYRMADEEQKKLGGNWVADVSVNREKQEKIVAILDGKLLPTDKNYDPEVAYSLGLNFQNVAGQLGSSAAKSFSKDISENLAREVWATNNQLPSLLDEWNRAQHGGPAETAFQSHLKNLAWQAFEGALQSKGNKVMPQLYFRRGMILGEKGDWEGSKREFLSAVDEAAKDTSISVRQEYTVTSHDALGIVAWKAGDYRSALSWFEKVDAEQKSFGGNWVPNIESKKQQMQAMINSKK